MSKVEFNDAAEWFDASPQVCVKCGALVHWQYTDHHVAWHADVEAAK